MSDQRRRRSATGEGRRGEARRARGGEIAAGGEPLTRVRVGVGRRGEVVALDLGLGAGRRLVGGGVVRQLDGLLVVHVRRLGPRRVGADGVHERAHAGPRRRLAAGAGRRARAGGRCGVRERRSERARGAGARGGGALLTRRPVEVRRRGRAVVGLQRAAQVVGLARQVRVRGDAVRRHGARAVLAQHQPRRHAAVPVLRTDTTAAANSARHTWTWLNTNTILLTNIYTNVYFNLCQHAVVRDIITCNNLLWQGVIKR